MKSSVALVAPFLSPAMASVVGVDWFFQGAPANGLSDVTWPITLTTTDQDVGYSVYQNLAFFGINSASSIGLQFVAPSNSTANNGGMYAYFKSYQGGTTSTYPGCSFGADGLAGITCRVAVSPSLAASGASYSFVVENVAPNNTQPSTKRWAHAHHPHGPRADSANSAAAALPGNINSTHLSQTWRGSLVDGASGQTIVIGQFNLPISAGGIQASQQGAIDYPPVDSAQLHDCGAIPALSASFGNPTSTTGGGLNGAITSVFQSGYCIGSENFKSSQTSSGWDVSVGF